MRERRLKSKLRVMSEGKEIKETTERTEIKKKGNGFDERERRFRRRKAMGG